MDITEIIKKVSNREIDLIGKSDFRSYSVLLPLLKKEGELHLLFEVRSKKLKKQPGEICFPGGKIDKNDHSAKHAAIRETCEELGISKRNINHVYPLDYILQPIEGRVIYPFVGYIDYQGEMNLNPNEVEEIFTVPLKFLLQTEPEVYTIAFQPIPEKNFPYHLIPGGKNYPWQTRTIKENFYFYQNYCIWGLTANILRHFLQIIKDE